MKVKIYVNTDDYCVGDVFPRVLTEKQYQEKIEELVKDTMEKENLKVFDAFSDMLAENHANTDIFFMEDEEKEKILREFRVSYVVGNVKDELESYYEKFEIEI